MNRLSARGYALSLWASKNVLSARILVVLGHLLLSATALFVGALLSPLLPGKLESALQIGLLLAAAGITLVYTSKSRNGTHTWASRKKLEGGLLACGMALMVLVGNGILERHTPASITAVRATTVTEKPVQQQSKAGKWLRKAVRWYNDLPLWVRIVYALFILAGAVYVALSIAALACSIACNGYETLAYIVLILGEVGVIVGLVYIYIGLFRGLKKQTKEQRAKREEKAKPESEKTPEEKERDARRARRRSEWLDE